MKVLVMEDDDDIALLLRIWLEKAGHQVFVYVGIVEGSVSQTPVLLNHEREAVQVDLSQFDLAFVDGNLVGPVLGTELVDPLKQFGVVSIANSNKDSVVTEFVRRGVDFVCKKTEIVGWIKTRLQEAVALRAARFASVA